jgi:hypothetical protein
MGITAKCEYCFMKMKGTIRDADSGASASVQYSMVSDGGAARAMHEAGLDE